jgi:hypothetical protein
MTPMRRFLLIVLGVHFMTDCIAAVIEAGGWLAICLFGAPGGAVFEP